MKKEEVIEELTKIYNQNGKINKNLIYEHSKTINKPLYQRMIEHFGNIDNMYSELGFSKTKRGYNKKEVNSDDILDIINKCYNDNAYVSKELLYLYSNIKKINILKYFKTNEHLDIKKLLLNNGFESKTLLNNLNIWVKKDIDILNKNSLNNIIININNRFNFITKNNIEEINKSLLIYIDKYYGSFENMINMLNLVVINKEEVNKEMERIFKLAEIEKVKISKHFIKINFKYGFSYFEKYYGINNKNIIKYNSKFDVTKNMVDDEILNIYNLSLSNGEKFNIRYYHKNSKYSWYLENKFYKSFQDAVIKLDIKSNILPECNLDDIKKEIISLYNEYNFFSVELFCNKNSLRNKAAKYVYDNVDGGFTTLCSELNIPLNTANKRCNYLINIIEEILNEKAKREYSFTWLRNSNNNKYRVDAYFENFNLIVEYNGKQHYEFVSRFHNTIEEFNKYVDDYNDKVKKLRANNFIVLEWKYNKTISYNNVKREIMKFIKL